MKSSGTERQKAPSFGLYYSRPLSFLVAFENLKLMTPSVEMIMFADDSSIIIKARRSKQNPSGFDYRMSAAVEEFAAKAKNIGPSVHPDKTKVEVVAGNKKTNVDIKVKLNGQDIEEVREQRLMGFMVNRKWTALGLTPRCPRHSAAHGSSQR